LCLIILFPVYVCAYGIKDIFYLITGGKINAE